jgi:hypothetical protein
LNDSLRGRTIECDSCVALLAELRAVHDRLSILIAETSQCVRPKREPRLYPIDVPAADSTWWQTLDAHEVSMRRALPDVPIDPEVERQLQIKNGFRPQLNEDISGGS